MLRQSFQSVAMFLDVSGFTKMSEALSRAGPGGEEKLSFFLNRYLEQLGILILLFLTRTPKIALVGDFLRLAKINRHSFCLFLTIEPQFQSIFGNYVDL